MKNSVRILMIGDVIGQPGCAMFQKQIGFLREHYAIDAVVVNGENSDSRGRGITSRIMNFYKHNGVDVVTSGNHIWSNNQIYDYLRTNTNLLRPANFPGECPGTGVTTFACNGTTIGVINLQGRIFMREHLVCPFRTAESLLTFLRDKTNIILVDFHAEATSEKAGMGWFLDGKVSAVVGTHSHVQTADERILPQGTAFITDVGMVGALNSMIGMKKDIILSHFLTQMPTKFLVETEPPFLLCGVVIAVDPQTGKAISIERIKIVDEAVTIEATHGS